MYKNVLLTVDLTDETSWRKALPAAVEYCRAFGATLHLLSVVPDFGMTVVAQFFPQEYEKGAIEQAKTELQNLSARHVPAGIEVQHIVAHGTIYQEILERRPEDQGRPHRHGFPPAGARGLPSGAERGAGGAPRRLLGAGGPGLRGRLAKNRRMRRFQTLLIRRKSPRPFSAQVHGGSYTLISLSLLPA